MKHNMGSIDRALRVLAAVVIADIILHESNQRHGRCHSRHRRSRLLIDERQSRFALCICR